MTALSLHHLTMIDARPLQLIDAAAAGGFEYCGIRLVAPRPGDPLVDVVNEPQSIRDIGRRLQHTGVKLLDIEAVWLSPHTNVDDLRHVIEVGATLGAKYLLTVGYDDDGARLLDNFTKLCAIAKPLGISVMLEFITYCSIGTLADAHRVVTESRMNNTGILIDALQFFRSGATPDDLDPIPARLFPYMQICDGLREAPASIDLRRREARTDRRLPGEGELPIQDLLQHVPKDITLSVEAPTTRLRGVHFVDQGKIIGEVTRRFLAKIESDAP
jgi:sugar phosphate isomerase/epimerase